MQLGVLKFNNIFFEESTDYAFNDLDELLFIEKVITALSCKKGFNFTDYEFHIISAIHPKAVPSSAHVISNRKKVLILLSEESGYIPNHLTPFYHAIFKAYIPTGNIQAKTIFNFSLGCVKTVPELPVIPLPERQYSVFFSGNLNNQRVALYLALCSFNVPKLGKYIVKLSVLKKLMVKLKYNFDTSFNNSYIRFTNGFKKGMSPNEYGHFMANSKIILCPKGFISAECFRHYEAMRAGCVIVSIKLPDTYFYKGSPIIQVNDWKEGIAKVRALLNNPTEMNEISIKTQEWWRNICSEKGTSEYVIACLKKLEKTEPEATRKIKIHQDNQQPILCI